MENGPSMFGAWLQGDAKLVRNVRGVNAVIDEMNQTTKLHDYSITRAMRYVAGMGGDAGYEREKSAAIAGALGREPRQGGMFIATRLRPQAAGNDTRTNAAGGYTRGTEVRDVIDLLRNRARVIQLGANVFSGLTSTVQFPKVLTASSGSWMAENPGSDVAASDATFGALTLSPKTYMATTSYSRQLLQQSSLDIEYFVRNQLATAHALAIDAAALAGTGTSNAPLGLLKTTGIGSVVISAPNGGVPTYAKVMELETAISDASADADAMKFLTTPGMRSVLRQALTVPNYGTFVWENGGAPGVGSMIGYPAYISKQVPQTLVSGASSDCHAVILGDWSQLLIGEFGVMEIISDPYSQKRKNMLEICSFQMIDIGIRQPSAFAAIQDARLS
jgi:HK97 family phage major capsid protein